MTDQQPQPTFPPGTAFGVTPAQQPYQAPQAPQAPTYPSEGEIVAHSAVQPVSGAETGAPAPSAVPAAARAGLRDRLKKRKVQEELVDLGDGDFVLVRGMDVYATDKMQARIRAMEDESGDDNSITVRNPTMMRSMVYSPEDGLPLYDDTWTDDEINRQPIGIVNKIMSAINKVMGLGGEPGKDSPSTESAAPSSE